MISKVTESNKELIKSRIAEINAALQAAGSQTVIDSFESYYANIVEISKLATNFHNAPYKYFLMPLDEPIFEIDANKRTISVPTHFSKNGVGVYGDHMAEVLYFSVDRYFDYQDLFNVDEIVINWQFRQSGSSRNAEVETNTSIALAPDDTFEPGKVVFGWVITNDMTPAKGTLTFSVSFLKRTGDMYEYVLNTQTASVVINDALVLEDPSALDNMSRPIFERLTNSRYTPENVQPLVDPTFRSGIVKDERGNIIAYKGLPSIANFEMDENGIEEKELMLQAIGYSEDDGNIKYLWHGTTFTAPDDTLEDDDSVDIDRAMDTPTVESDYVLTNDISPDENIVYYVKVGQVMLPLPCDYDEDEIEETVEEAFNDPNVEVYELGSSSFIFKVDEETGELIRENNKYQGQGITKAGQYGVTIQTEKEITEYVEANDVSASTNFADTNNLYYIQNGNGYSLATSYAADITYYKKKVITMKSGNIASQSCFVPVAAVPAVALTVQGVSTDEGQYAIVNKDDAAGYTFIDDQAPEVNATITIDEGKIYNSENENTIYGVTENSEIGAIALVLSDSKVAPNNFAELEANDSFKVIPLNTPISLNNSSDAEGTYRVFAINRRNHTYSVSDASNELVVSKIAPFLNQINVNGIYDNSTVELINNNEDTGNHISMERTTGYNCEIEVGINDADLTKIELAVKIIEVEIADDGSIARYLENTEDDTPNVYDEFVIRDGKYVFNVNNDSGHFIVRATTTYHGTQRISETEPFTITWDK